jgi:hypothetical protein
MQGLLISLAKCLGKLWGRVGRVFSDRFTSGRCVCRALCATS